jgi:segregation and condensation protein A
MSPTEVCVVQEEFKNLPSNETRILDIIFKEDELTWKEMIYDLVRNENMDPWDVDITLLAEKFLYMLKKLKQMDFRIGGKIILASSLLLKLKSDRLVGEDMRNFEQLLVEQSIEEGSDDDSSEFEQTNINSFLNDQKRLIPRTPQPRERKVSVFDLVDALEKALDSDIVRQKNRILRGMEIDTQVEMPKNFFEIGKAMEALQQKMAKMFTTSTTKVMFDELLTSNDKQTKVYTFMPLLHLENQRMVEMMQKEHFGPIEIKIINTKSA